MNMKNKVSNEKNWQERIMEQYMNGELQVLKRKDTFNFDCVRCGECCRNRTDILLNPFDFFRLCRAKKISPKDFITKYCVLYVGHSSFLPLIRVDFRPVYDVGGENVIGTRCPFLGRKGELFHCRVNDAKPFVCFAYPLGRHEKDTGEIEYVLQDGLNCAGGRKAQADGTSQVVEEWMQGKEKVDLEERYLPIFDNFLKTYHEWIDVEKLAKCNMLEGRLFRIWLANIAEILYMNYDFDADDEAFLAQFALNIKAVETVCKTFVEHFASVIDLRPKKE